MDVRRGCVSVYPADPLTASAAACIVWVYRKPPVILRDFWIWEM